MVKVTKDAIDGWAWTSDTPVEEAIVDALIAAAGDEEAIFRVSRKHPGTSRAIVAAIREGSVQDEILDWFISDSANGGDGLTDDDLEIVSKRSHQSVSAARNHLVKRGYLTNSGKTRKNRWGNDAVVWSYTDKPVERP